MWSQGGALDWIWIWIWKVRRSAPAPATAEATATANVIEIPSSPDPTAGAGGKKEECKRASPDPTAGAGGKKEERKRASPDPTAGAGGKKKERKRASPDPTAGAGGKKKERKRAPPSPLDLDGVEMWTPRQKRRLDDECCVLSADPLAADEAPAVVPTSNDDVAVVAERGKVACRDYPHPRSACARYPFRSTPHESHCEQCFCYVCDIAAPCVSWKGYGGHCHASDKGTKWKTMRVARQRQCK